MLGYDLCIESYPVDFLAGFVEVFAWGLMKLKIVETSCSWYGGFEFGWGC